MRKRVTIKDIAEEAGVSTGTVHRAIYGKKGVTEEVRQRILDICAKRGYQTNTAASALKRGTVRIAAAFPGPDTNNRFFYDNVWRGFRRQIAELHDYSLEIVELPYYAGTMNDQAAELEACYERYQGELDALITVGHFNAACRQVVRKYVDHGIPVFLACDDTPDCGRIACVQANYEITGRIVAELISSQLPAGSAVLLCAGDVLIPSHYRTVLGFEDYIRENKLDLTVIKIHGYDNADELRSRLMEALINHPEIRVIASDLFQETIQNMEAGIVKNIIYKDPESQAYLATKVMSEYLLKAQKPLNDIQYVESRVIFRSSLSLYTEDR